MNRLLVILFCFTSLLIQAQHDSEVKVFENDHEGFIVLNEKTKEFYYTNNDGVINTHMPIVLGRIVSRGKFENLSPSVLKLKSQLPDQVLDEITEHFNVQYEDDTTKGRTYTTIDLRIDDYDFFDNYPRSKDKLPLYDVLLCSDRLMYNNDDTSDGDNCITLKLGVNKLIFPISGNIPFTSFTIKAFPAQSNPATRDFYFKRSFVETKKIKYKKNKKITVTIDNIFRYFFIEDINSELLYRKSEHVVEFRGEEFVLNSNRVLTKNEDMIFSYYQ